MVTMVNDHTLTELLDLPDHRAMAPDAAPRSRALRDDLLQAIWSLPAEKRAEAALLIRAFIAARRKEKESGS